MQTAQARPSQSVKRALCDRAETERLFEEPLEEEDAQAIIALLDWINTLSIIEDLYGKRRHWDGPRPRREQMRFVLRMLKNEIGRDLLSIWEQARSRVEQEAQRGTCAVRPTAPIPPSWTTREKEIVMSEKNTAEKQETATPTTEQPGRLRRAWQATKDAAKKVPMKAVGAAVVVVGAAAGGYYYFTKDGE